MERQFLFTTEGTTKLKAASDMLHKLNKLLPKKTKLVIWGKEIIVGKKRNWNNLVKTTSQYGSTFKCSVTLDSKLARYLLG